MAELGDKSTGFLSESSTAASLHEILLGAGEAEGGDGGLVVQFKGLKPKVQYAPLTLAVALVRRRSYECRNLHKTVPEIVPLSESVAGNYTDE